MNSTYIKRYAERFITDIAFFEKCSIKQLESVLMKYKIGCCLDKMPNCGIFHTAALSKRLTLDEYSFINNKYLPRKMKKQVRVYF